MNEHENHATVCPNCGHCPTCGRGNEPAQVVSPGTTPYIFPGSFIGVGDNFRHSTQQSPNVSLQGWNAERVTA